MSLPWQLMCLSLLLSGTIPKKVTYHLPHSGIARLNQLCHSAAHATTGRGGIGVSIYTVYQGPASDMKVIPTLAITDTQPFTSETV